MSDPFYEITPVRGHYRVPENEPGLPGYVTVRGAAHILSQRLLPASDLFGFLTQFIPCRLEIEDRNLVAVSRRVILEIGDKWKSVRVRVPINEEAKFGGFQKYVNLIKGFLFTRLLSKDLKYSLLSASHAVVNRPSTRETIYFQRNFAFETGFVKWGDPAKRNLGLLLVHKMSIQEHPEVTGFVKLWESFKKSRLTQEDIEVLGAFLNELRLGAENKLQFSKGELRDACRYILYQTRQRPLRSQSFDDQVWNSRLVVGLRIRSAAGKQGSSRHRDAEAIIGLAKIKFLSSKVANTD